jgi:hypothetical protein
MVAAVLGLRLAAMFEHLIQIIFEGATYDFFRWLAVSLIVAIGATTVVKVVFDKLKENKETFTFLAMSFVVVLALCYLIAAKPQQPILAGTIQSIATGGLSNDAKDTVAIVSMSIMNSGTMPSIPRNWTVQAVINGQTYTPSFVPMPKTFTFNLPEAGPNSPKAIVYHGEDDLLQKSVLPIQPGGLMAGLLFVVFEGIPASVFQSGGADFTVTYQDVLSNKYEATQRTTAKFSNIPIVPGLHTDLACPVPPGGPALPNSPALR